MPPWLRPSWPVSTIPNVLTPGARRTPSSPATSTQSDGQPSRWAARRSGVVPIIARIVPGRSSTSEIVTPHVGNNPSARIYCFVSPLSFPVCSTLDTAAVSNDGNPEDDGADGHEDDGSGSYSKLWGW